MPMPNRNSTGNYRYAYQGQEKDPETGKEAFQLRLWDARIGRWLTTDPAGQFSSPYLGMGNNPINGVDPDGAWVKGAGFWNNLFHSDSHIYQNDYGFSAAEAQAIVGGDMMHLDVVELSYTSATRKHRSNYSPLPGFTPSYKDQKGGPVIISLSADIAQPFLPIGFHNGKDVYGYGIEFGYNGYTNSFYRSTEIIKQRSLSFGTLDYNIGVIENLNGKPITESRLEGLGTEKAISIIGGYSVGSDNIQKNNYEESYRIHEISIGISTIGFDLGFLQAETYTKFY